MQLSLCATADMASIVGAAREMWVRDHVSSDAMTFLADAGPEWTAAYQGEVVGCGGFVECEGDAAIAWGLVRADLSLGAALALTKTVRAQLANAPYRWIEAQIVEGFAASLRWMATLGFRPVNGTRLFGPDGQEFHRFVFRG